MFLVLFVLFCCMGDLREVPLGMGAIIGIFLSEGSLGMMVFGFICLYLLVAD